jgi:hypothetical protein
MVQAIYKFLSVNFWYSADRGFLWAYLDLTIILCQGVAAATNCLSENLELLEIPRALQYRQDEDKEVIHESKADLSYRIALQ